MASLDPYVLLFVTETSMLPVYSYDYLGDASLSPVKKLGDARRPSATFDNNCQPHPGRYAAYSKHCVIALLGAY